MCITFRGNVSWKKSSFSYRELNVALLIQFSCRCIKLFLNEINEFLPLNQISYSSFRFLESGFFLSGDMFGVFILKFLLRIRQLLFQHLEILLSSCLSGLLFSDVYFLDKILCSLKSQLLMNYQSTISHRCFLKYKFLDRYFSRIFHRHLDQLLRRSTFVF